MDYFKSLSDLARAYLLQLADRVTHVVPTDVRDLRISTHGLDPAIEQKDLLDEVSTWMRKDYLYLYYFQVMNNPDLAKVESAFSDAKKGKKNGRAYPRFNNQSEFIYVGSSSNIFQRFKEHLGYGSQSTYSLQLAHWARDLNLELNFVCARYSEDIASDITQAIEDRLWDVLSPMFGRKGPR